MQNAKNRLYEFMRELGYRESQVGFEAWEEHGGIAARATAHFADGREVSGSGWAEKRTAAEIDAAEATLIRLEQDHPDLCLDWEQVFMEAQAGDALIKLCAYLSPELDSPEKKSRWLQERESDAYLTARFDRLQAEGHPSVALFGENLGHKRKATWMEALVWRDYGGFLEEQAGQGAMQKLFGWLGEE